MEKFKGKYRIKSHRRPNWDYSADAFYFLTIVTQNRECHLGDIVKTNDDIYLQLSEFGKIVDDEWYKSFEIRDELVLHAYVLMPNHLHTIVEICNNKRDVIGLVDPHGRRDLRGTMENQTDLSSIKRNRPVRLPQSISSFIAGFKSAVNSKIDDYIDGHQLNIPKFNRNNHFFQPNYHDHIIRNRNEYDRISHYIQNNPKNWHNDKLKGKI